LGLLPVFLAAAAVMALGTATVGVWPLREVAGLERDLAVFMPDPELVRQPAPDEGPVLVTLTYTVEDDQVPAFIEVMARSAAPGCAPARAVPSCTRTGRTPPSSFRSRSTPPGGNTCASTPAG